MKKARKATSKTPALNLEIEGGRKLHGTIETNSSKNGAMVLLCASLLNRGWTILRNIPQIEEVKRMIEVFESIGVKVSRRGKNLTIKPPRKFTLEKINRRAAQKTRSIIMCLGPLIHSQKKFSLPQSGGCELGKRTIHPHFLALNELGVSIKTTEDSYDISYKKLHPGEIILAEASDTATANSLLAAAKIPGTTTIKYASANYQVQELCFFLQTLGVSIEGVGTAALIVRGKKEIEKDADYSVSEDPTDSMFFIAAAAVTKSRLKITRCPIDFLELELFTLKLMGLKYKKSKAYFSKNGRTRLVDLEIFPSSLQAPPEKIHPRPYPGINIDNLPFFAVIATKARGQTLIHDWVYEKRALYYTELDRLGASTVLADPHRFFVNGPSELTGVELVCPPALRPATIILIAMLSAKGESVLRNIYSINRGYEDLVSRLKNLGAKIKVLPD